MKSTKRSLLMSILSLILCFTMLLGTTFAWFTDSVTSGKNQIIAGNLDVELKHYKTDEASATAVKDATNLFSVTRWEPGVVAYENFIVSNEGTLALKYALNLNVFDKNETINGNDLTEVIKVAVIEGGFNGDRALAQLRSFSPLGDFQKTGNLKAKGNSGSSDTWGVILYWAPTDNDNLYNLKNGLKSNDNQPLFVEFGVNLVATQDTVESDSFDDQYDKKAEFPVTAAAKVEAGKATKLTAYDGNNTLAAKTEIPADAPLPDGTAKVVMTVDEIKTPAEVIEELEEDQVALNLDVKFFSVKSDGSQEQITDFGGALVEVDLSAQIPEGKTLAKVFHTHDGEAVEMTSVSKAEDVTDGKYYYNTETKMLTIGSTTFSPFTLVLDPVLSPVEVHQPDGETVLPFEELQAALDAAADGATVIVNKDITLNAGVSFENKALTIQGKDETVTITRGGTFGESMFTVGGKRGEERLAATTLTLKNIILDDQGIVGTYDFAEHLNGNTWTTEPAGSTYQAGIIEFPEVGVGQEDKVVTIILDDGAKLRNFGGWSAICAHFSGGTCPEIELGNIIMRDGSVIEDTMDIAHPNDTSVILEGICTLFQMEKGSEVCNIKGVTLYNNNKFDIKTSKTTSYNYNTRVNINGKVHDITGPDTDQKGGHKLIEAGGSGLHRVAFGDDCAVYRNTKFYNLLYIQKGGDSGSRLDISGHIYENQGYYKGALFCIGLNGGVETVVHSKAIIENNRVEGNTENENWNSAIYYTSQGTNKTLTIEDGAKILNNVGTKPQVYIVKTYPTTVKILGGTFLGENGGFGWDNSTGKIVTITGGTFSNDVSSFLSSEYTAQNNGDGTWTVMPKGYTKTDNGAEISTKAALEYAVANAKTDDTIVWTQNLEGDVHITMPEGVEKLNIKVGNYYATGTLYLHGEVFNIILGVSPFVYSHPMVVD